MKNTGDSGSITDKDFVANPEAVTIFQTSPLNYPYSPLRHVNTYSTRQPPTPPISFLLKNHRQDRITLLSRLIQAYPNIVRIPFSNAIVVNHPDFVQHVLQKNPDNYLKGDLPLQRVEAALGYGLLTNQGHAWSECRRAVLPHFAPLQTKNMIPRIAQMTETAISAWSNQITHPEGFDFTKSLMSLLLKMVAQLFFHLELGSQADVITRLIAQGNRYVSNSPSVALLWPSLGNVFFQLGKKKLDKLLSELIIQHHPHNDLMDTLQTLRYNDGAPLTKRQLLDEFKTLLITGHETTGSALLWTLYCLQKHPHYLKAVTQEILSALPHEDITYEDLTKLPLTCAIFEETLRLFPPIWLTGRIAVQEDQINGYQIPKHATVLICPYTLHRHPDFWEDPETFRPERFLNPTPKPYHASYIPFGLGPRRCIAAHFSVQQGITILATLIKNVSLEIKDLERIKIEPLISLRPAPNLWVTLKKRT